MISTDITVEALSTGVVEATSYAGILYYKEDGVQDLVTFTSAKKLNALLEVYLYFVIIIIIIIILLFIIIIIIIIIIYYSMYSLLRRSILIQRLDNMFTFDLCLHIVVMIVHTLN